MSPPPRYAQHKPGKRTAENNERKRRRMTILFSRTTGPLYQNVNTINRHALRVSTTRRPGLTLACASLGTQREDHGENRGVVSERSDRHLGRYSDRMTGRYRWNCEKALESSWSHLESSDDGKTKDPGAAVPPVSTYVSARLQDAQIKGPI